MSPWKQKNLIRWIVYGTLCLAVGSYVYLGYGKWIDMSVDSLFHWRTSAVDSARDYRGHDGSDGRTP